MLGMKGHNEELSSKFELKYIRSQNNLYCENVGFEEGSLAES